MRVAALYDIHANLPALEAVLAEARRQSPDLVLIGGDVLPGPMPVETLDFLSALDIPAQFIQGNGDRETLAVLDGTESAVVPEYYRPIMRWVAAQLRPDQIDWIRNWPATLHLDVAAPGGVLFCHATPRSDTELFTRLSSDEDLAPIFQDLAEKIVVCGHTHMQFERTVAGVRILNAGSVGMPFGKAGADWLMLDDAGPAFRHTELDLEAAAQRIRQSAYPQAQEFAAQNVLSPPPEEQVLEVFTKASRRTAC
jgi:predicted phosphodiesterase